MKVNAVLNATTGRYDVVSLLRFCLANGYQLRFIEQMLLDAGHKWQRGTALSADAVLTALREHFAIWPRPSSAELFSRAAVAGRRRPRSHRAGWHRRLRDAPVLLRL